ncbi:YqaJ viral recombinase family protein [Burkholderia gladioli]|uniref:YqaJ viral recombinase family protein n=1 Tax=Burkholderia gladioli TaxID=28095 RepID=UPI0031330E6D
MHAVARTAVLTLTLCSRSPWSSRPACSRRSACASTPTRSGERRPSMRDPRHYPDPHDPCDPVDAYLPEHDDDEPFEQGFVPPHAHPNRAGASSQSGSIPACPKCQSDRVDARHRGRKAGGAVGAIAGTASGVALALSGTRPSCVEKISIGKRSDRAGYRKNGIGSSDAAAAVGLSPYQSPFEFWLIQIRRDATPAPHFGYEARTRHRHSREIQAYGCGSA